MIQNLSIQKKRDNEAKLAAIIEENIPADEYVSADEMNALVAKVQEMIPLVNAATGGFQGTILASDKPTAMGFYFPKESKKYVNTGGFDIDLTKGVYIITNDGKKWDIVFSPFLANGEVKEGDNRPISGDTAYKKIQEENEWLRGVMEAQNVANSVFVSTWDTTNLSEGSSDEYSVKLPINTYYEMNFITDWGDGKIVKSVFKEGVYRNFLSQSKKINIKKERTKDIPLVQSLKGMVRLTIGSFKMLEGEAPRFFSAHLLSENKKTLGYIDVNITEGQPLTSTLNVTEDVFFLRLYTGESLNNSLGKFVEFNNVMLSSGGLVEYVEAYEDALSHKYKTKGLKTISISGEIRNFSFGGIRDRYKILQVLSYGKLNINTSGVFQGCNNLLLENTIGKPNISSATFLNQFRYCLNNKRIRNIDKFDVGSVKIFDGTFSFIPFDGKGIEQWNVESMQSAINFIDSVNLTPITLEFILENWSKQSLQNDVTISFGRTKLTTQAKKYKDKIVNTYNWTIQDGGDI